MRTSDIYAANRWLPLREEIAWEMVTPQTADTICTRVATAEAILARMRLESNPVFDEVNRDHWPSHFRMFNQRELAKMAKDLRLFSYGTNPYSIKKTGLQAALVRHYREVTNNADRS